ncbi:hypothetical protein DdX_15162 [Ditylenchus destructor]|uniref:Uncharacterized protein n=1 Tax=Ditylenchus destructor TaxID=166010 RepID=A0AAD4QV09_9BILA|nr:hypothetical protein DdX_15162 [Ditylenchus destructor]
MFQVMSKTKRQAFTKSDETKVEVALEEFKKGRHGNDPIRVLDLLKMTTIDALRHAMTKVFFYKGSRVYALNLNKCPDTALLNTGDQKSKCPYNTLAEIVQKLAGITVEGSMDGKAVDQMIEFYRSVQRILQDEIEKSKKTGNSHGISTAELLYDFAEVSKDLKKTLDEVHRMNDN